MQLHISTYLGVILCCSNILSILASYCSSMILLRHIVAASSILLVLLSTPAVVEGTNDCAEVCPLSYLWESEKEWYRQKTCLYGNYM